MMLRRLSALLLALIMLPCFAMAEDASGVTLVDAITDPKALEGFSFKEGADLLEIVFPQILDSDAALIRCGGKTMLLDCSTAQQANRVTAMLQQMGVTKLDYVVNSHPHYDHIQGLEAVVQAVQVSSLYICFPEDETDHMVEAMRVAEKYGIPVHHYGDGDQFTLGEAVFDVWMKCDETCDLNERSAQMRLQYGSRTALFTADMLNKTQTALMEHIAPELLDIDILKYPHHGKKAMNATFLDLLSPSFAVITNNGGKPSREGRKSLGYKHIPYATTVPGYVYCVTDGQTWLVQRLDMDNPVTVTSRPDTR